MSLMVTSPYNEVVSNILSANRICRLPGLVKALLNGDCVRSDCCWRLSLLLVVMIFYTICGNNVEKTKDRF